MYIITASNFQVPYDIPNANEIDSKSFQLLNRLIDNQVRLLLQKCLGFTLFAELDSNIEDGVLKVDADQKWKDLVNGKIYELNDKTYNWKGLIDEQGNSLLVPFVYYHFVIQNQQSLTSLGVKALEANNASNVDPNPLAIMAWNSFVKEYQGVYFDRYGFNPAVYNLSGGVTFVDYFRNSNESGYVDLLTFLSDNKETYPDAPLWTYNFKNRYE